MGEKAVDGPAGGKAAAGSVAEIAGRRSRRYPGDKPADVAAAAETRVWEEGAGGTLEIGVTATGSADLAGRAGMGVEVVGEAGDALAKTSSRAVLAGRDEDRQRREVVGRDGMVGSGEQVRRGKTGGEVGND